MIQPIIDSVWDFLRRPVYYGAIHLHVTDAGEQEITWCIGKVAKDELSVTDSGTGYASLLKAKKKLFVDPLFGVGITGQPILVKAGEAMGFAGQGDSMVNQSFTWQDYTYSAVARKDAIHDLLVQLEDDSLLLGDIYLGPSPLGNEQLGITTPVQLYPYQVSVEGAITPVAKEEAIGYHTIDGEEVPRTEVLARAILVHLVTQEAGVADQLSLSAAYDYEIGFKKVAIAGLPVLFLLTVVGYLVHSSTSQTRNQLLSELNRIESTHKETLQKAELVSRTKSLLGSLGSGARYALFLDSVAQTVPGGIKLQELKVNPNQNRKLKPGKPIRFEDNVWVIEGLVKNANILDNWIIELNEFAWVNQTHIEQYGLDDVYKGYHFQLNVDVKLDQL